MGANVSAHKSYYLLDGYKTYASTGNIRKFTSSEENRLFWNGQQRLVGSETQTDKNGKYLYHRVTPGHYIVGVKIRGAARNEKYGIMTITDSNNSEFQVPCDVHVPKMYQPKVKRIDRDDEDDDDAEAPKTPDQWTTEYVSPAWETSGLGIFSIGMTIKKGCTVLTDLQSRLRPQMRTMKFEGVGVIGWLIDEDNQPIGFICDRNCWIFFSEQYIVNPDSVRCRYFKPGYVMSAIQWERYKESSLNISHEPEQSGRARIVMTAINSDHHSISYVATQKNILPITNTCVIDNDQFKVLKGLRFLIVPGASSVDCDFMVTGPTELGEFVEPDPLELSNDELEDAKQSMLEKTPVVIPVLQPVTKEDHLDVLPKQVVTNTTTNNNNNTTTPAMITTDFVWTTLAIILIIGLSLTVMYFVYQNYQREHQSKMTEERKKLELSMGTSAQSIHDFLNTHQHHASVDTGLEEG